MNRGGSQRKEALIELLIATIGVAIAAITRYIIPWAKQVMKEIAATYQLKRFFDFTEKAVRAANQTLTPEQWDEKKDRVQAYLMRKIEKMHIDLDEEDLENIIEGIVNKVKEEKAKGN